MTEHEVRARFSPDIDSDKLAEAALTILSLTLHDGCRVWALVLTSGLKPAGSRRGFRPVRSCRLQDDAFT